MTDIVIIALLIMNAAAFCVMGLDKNKAVRGAWRIPEKTLFLVAGLFGGLGGTIGMFFFHHKTRHWYFRFGFPTLTVIQAVILFLTRNYWLR